MRDYIVGTTKQFTWINSGTVGATIAVSIWTGSETMVSSSAMVSSGPGHYYTFSTLPEEPGFYKALFDASVIGYPFKHVIQFRTVLGDVD